MTSVLLQFLERTEFNKLPKGVQNKLEKIVRALQNANESLKNQHERLKADSGKYISLQFAIHDKNRGVCSFVVPKHL